MSFLIIAAVAAGYAFSSIVDKVRIGSERYDQIITIKELQSEVALPSLQLTEVQLRVQELVLAEGAIQPSDVDSIPRLAREYERGYEAWRIQFAQFASPDLQIAIEASHEAAGVYFKELKGPFLAAAEAGDRALMQEVATSTLAQQYALQQATANRVDTVAQEQLEEAERAAASGLVTDRRLMLAAGLAFGLLAAGLTLITLRSMTSRLRRLRNLADKQFPRLVAQADLLADVEGETASYVAPTVRGHDQLAHTERAFHRVINTALEMVGAAARLRQTTSDLFVYTGRRNQQLLAQSLNRLSSLDRVALDSQHVGELAELRCTLTRLRRNAESMLVIAGVAPMRQWDEPVAPVQPLRAALAEIAAPDRVEFELDDSVEILGPAGSDLAHLLAELLDNATSFSLPETTVTVSGTRESDGYVIVISDEGLGIPAPQLASYNEMLADWEAHPHDSRRLGLSVVARLGDRHDFEVSLAQRPTGGLVARVALPESCLKRVDARPDLDTRGFDDHGPVLSLAGPAAPVASAVAQRDPLPRRIRGANLEASLREVPAYVGSPERRSPEAVRDALTALKIGQAAAADQPPGQSDLTS